MNIYTYHISLRTYITKENFEENNEVMIECQPVDIGPFQLPDSYMYTVKVIKNIISEIITAPVSYNWWTDLSTWEDYHGILRSGTTLSIHSVVTKIEDKIKSLANCYLEWIDENGNILINLHEISSTVHQEFEITGRRKKLRRLEQIAAFNVATQLSCQSDTKDTSETYLKISKYVRRYIFC